MSRHGPAMRVHARHSRIAGGPCSVRAAASPRIRSRRAASSGHGQACTKARQPAASKAAAEPAPNPSPYPASGIPPAGVDIPAAASSRSPSATSTAGRRTTTRPPSGRSWRAAGPSSTAAENARVAAAVYRALVRGLPQGARRRKAPDDAKARAFFEENFRRLARREARRSERLSHRLLRADCRRLAHSDRRLQGAALPPAARSRASGASARQAGPRARPRGATAAAKTAPYFDRAADRGRRARGRQPRDLLSQGPERRRSSSRSRARRASGSPTARAARQLRCAQRPSLYAGRPHPDRARHHRARRHVDGPHPPMDGGKSGRRQRAAAAEQVLRVLPRHRTCRNTKRRGARRACRSRPAARSRSTARCMSTARRSSSRPICRSRAKSRTRNSAG